MQKLNIWTLSEVNPTIYKRYLYRLQDTVCVFSEKGGC